MRWQAMCTQLLDSCQRVAVDLVVPLLLACSPVYVLRVLILLVVLRALHPLTGLLFLLLLVVLRLLLALLTQFASHLAVFLLSRVELRLQASFA